MLSFARSKQTVSVCPKAEEVKRISTSASGTFYFLLITAAQAINHRLYVGAFIWSRLPISSAVSDRRRQVLTRVAKA